MAWAGGCLGSQPPRPFCLFFHSHFLLPLTALLFTFSFSAHSIKAKDLRFSSSNFPANSIFSATSQSAVTGSLDGSLNCAIGITGAGEPIYCETGGDCTDGDPSTPCICIDSSSVGLPDISAFNSHLCVDPQLYHPKIHIISDPRSQSCPAPYTVDVNISVSNEANKYIRAMSYRYVAQWIKNYTPKCWAGLQDSECPGGVALDAPNAPKTLLVNIPSALTSANEQSHCCSKATGGPSNPVFGGFDPTATATAATANSKTHNVTIDTLNATTCNVQLNTKLSCGGTTADFCSYCPTTAKYTTWKLAEPCMCEPAGTSCGTCSTCSGSPPYQCVAPNTSCSGGRTWDSGSCSCVCSSGLVWNGSSCISPTCTPPPGPCESCVLGSLQNNCQFGEVCCGVSCKVPKTISTCPSGQIPSSSGCSCVSSCTLTCGTGQRLDSVNCQCEPYCTSNSQCSGSCNSCDLNTNTCTGGCSGSQDCCNNTCYNQCSSGQTRNSSCNCVTVNPCASCSSGQDCCNNTCYNQCLSGQTRNSSCNCVTVDPCASCSSGQDCCNNTCYNQCSSGQNKKFLLYLCS